MVGDDVLEFLQKAGAVALPVGGHLPVHPLVGLAGLVFLLLQMVSDGVDWILKPRGPPGAGDIEKF